MHPTTKHAVVLLAVILALTCVTHTNQADFAAASDLNSRFNGTAPQVPRQPPQPPPPPPQPPQQRISQPSPSRPPPWASTTAQAQPSPLPSPAPAPTSAGFEDIGPGNCRGHEGDLALCSQRNQSAEQCFQLCVHWPRCVGITLRSWSSNRNRCILWASDPAPSYAVADAEVAAGSTFHQCILAGGERDGRVIVATAAQSIPGAAVNISLVAANRCYRYSVRAPPPLPAPPPSPPPPSPGTVNAWYRPGEFSPGTSTWANVSGSVSTASSASHAVVGVCVTGELRTLLSHPVVHSFREHVVSALHRAGFAPETFFVVSGAWEDGTQVAKMRAAIRSSYRAVSIVLWNDTYTSSIVNMLSAQHESRCKIHKLWTLLGSLRQWVTVRACYDQVVGAEARRGMQYRWLIRTRTDLAYLSDLCLSKLSLRYAYLPAAGMHDEMRCLNDHIFVCPRPLCRSYFTLIDLWLSGRCNSSDESVEPIFARANSGRGWTLAPLSGTYSLPTVPAWASGEYPGKAGFGPALQYMFYALYTDGNVPHRDFQKRRWNSSSCSKGGLLREMDWAYTIARGNATVGGISCNSRWNLWTSRATPEQELRMRAVANSSGEDAARNRARCWKLHSSFPIRRRFNSDAL